MTRDAQPGEIHSDSYCLHPYYGFVCTPNAVIDFSFKVPAHFRHGASARIDADGFRNDGIPATKPADEFWIGLFGGSVAFSVPSSCNATTIAGQLERQLTGAGFGAGRTVRVLNLAVPGGQQPQQLLIFLMNLERLDGVVTFDGVNEVVVPACYNLGALPSEFPYLPIYEGLYGRGISDEQLALAWLRRDAVQRFERRSRIWRMVTARRHRLTIRGFDERLRAASASPSTFASLFRVEKQSAEDAIESGARTWRSCTAQMHAIARAAGVQTLFTVQPIPDRNKPTTANESAYLEESREIVALRRAGYARILELAAELRRDHVPVVALTDVFEGMSEELYTDLIHFEDRGCTIVAERLAALIKEQWQPVPRSNACTAAAGHHNG